MDPTDDGNDAPGPLAITISTAGDLGAARAALRTWLRVVVSDEQIDEIVLASGEALANALEHGRPPITMSGSWDGGMLRVTVRDSGAWTVSAGGRRQGGSSRGLGIPIMTALTDSLTFETTDGTAVVLTRLFRTRPDDPERTTPRNER